MLLLSSYEQLHSSYPRAFFAKVTIYRVAGHNNALYPGKSPNKPNGESDREFSPHATRRMNSIVAHHSPKDARVRMANGPFRRRNSSALHRNSQQRDGISPILMHLYTFLVFPQKLEAQ